MMDTQTQEVGAESESAHVEIDPQLLKNIVESALLASGQPMSVEQLQALFDEEAHPSRQAIRSVAGLLQEEYLSRGIELVEVSSGYRIQVRKAMRTWVSRLWSEKPGRYSRALLETLAIIAYRQPVTRGEIEEIRGVGVATNIVRTLQERNWIRVVGYRDVPGKPAMFGTTRDFLDYFGLKRLDDLPALQELADFADINIEPELPFEQDSAQETT
jgi:segregation and condensation protein B